MFKKFGFGSTRTITNPEYLVACLLAAFRASNIKSSSDVYLKGRRKPSLPKISANPRQEKGWDNKVTSSQVPGLQST